jgi:peptidoglycan/LPS O-acetylase OafA/YrhL
MFHHFLASPILEAARSAGHDSVTRLISPIVGNGFLGVNVFFILSGIVLYRIELGRSLASAMDYYQMRARRLLPLYVLTILAVGAIEHDSVGSIVSNLVWLPTGAHDLAPSRWAADQVLWVCWSLGVEILFSLVLPVLVLASRYWELRRIVVIICVFSFAYRVAGDSSWFSQFPGYHNPYINPLKDNIFGRIDDFAVGMFAGALIRADNWRPSVIAVLLASAGLLASLVGWSEVAVLQRTIPVSVAVSALHTVLSASVATLMVAASRRSLWRWRAWDPLIFMGTACYSAYFAHAALIKYVPLLDTKNYWQDTIHSWLTLGVMFLVFCVSTFAVSTMTFAFVEAFGIRRPPPWASTLRRLAASVAGRACGALRGRRFASANQGPGPGTAIGVETRR